MPPEINVEVVPVAGTETVAAVVPAVATVQETVAAAVAVAEAVKQAAESVAKPDAELLQRFGMLESEVRNLSERNAALEGRTQSISDQIATMQVAAVIEEVDEAPAVVLPPVEIVPPDSIPSPQAPEVRTKKKRHFL